MPKSLTHFLNTLLINPGHISMSSTNCLIESFSQDLINGVTRGRVTMHKYFTQGASSYQYGSTVCQSETAEAEIARQLYKEGASPGLRPISEDDLVLTHF